VTEQEIQEPAVAAGVVVAEVFSFGDTLERMLEVLLVVIVGVSLASHWSWGGAGLALVLLFVIRPLATIAVLTGSPTTRRQRWLIGWFGIRGVGSIYYLAYAMTHGLDASQSEILADLVLPVVALSILLHGVSSQPLMSRYEKRSRNLSHEKE
jgi:NhaP-type Na+/H+ or K+/H+ antiporter